MSPVMPAEPSPAAPMASPGWRRLSVGVTALAVLLIGGAAILAALAFEHIGGYAPCALCLIQRNPYYFGLPLAALAAVSARQGWSPWIARLALLGVAGLFVWGASVGVYQSGAEWGFWQGPTDCGAGGAIIPKSTGGLLEGLEAGRGVPSCTTATWRLAWLSFAGWNAVVSAGLALTALFGVVLSLRRG